MTFLTRIRVSWTLRRLKNAELRLCAEWHALCYYSRAGGFPARLCDWRSIVGLIKERVCAVGIHVLSEEASPPNSTSQSSSSSSQKVAKRTGLLFDFLFTLRETEDIILLWRWALIYWGYSGVVFFPKLEKPLSCSNLLHSLCLKMYNILFCCISADYTSCFINCA